MDLQEGKMYTLESREIVDEGTKRKLVKRKMRLVKKYPHLALFEDSKGQKTSFRYWDLEKMLGGEGTGRNYLEK